MEPINHFFEWAKNNNWQVDLSAVEKTCQSRFLRDMESCQMHIRPFIDNLTSVAMRGHLLVFIGRRFFRE